MDIIISSSPCAKSVASSEVSKDLSNDSTTTSSCTIPSVSKCEIQNFLTVSDDQFFINDFFSFPTTVATFKLNRVW